MAYIVMSIIGLLALVFVKKDWQQKKQIIFVGAVIILGALLYVFIDIFILQSRNGITKGNFFAKIPWLEIGLYFIMLLGMASKYLFDAIGEKKRKKIKFNKWQFIKPILVSPIPDDFRCCLCDDPGNHFRLAAFNICLSKRFFLAHRSL